MRLSLIMFTPVMPLVQPAKKIAILNVPTFIRDDMTEKEHVMMQVTSAEPCGNICGRRQTHMIKSIMQMRI